VWSPGYCFETFATCDSLSDTLKFDGVSAWLERVIRDLNSEIEDMNIFKIADSTEGFGFVGQSR